MPKPKSPFPHRPCRPPRGPAFRRIHQLNLQGRWTLDDGAPGLAFIWAEADDTSATIWATKTCTCPTPKRCPTMRAFAYAAALGCGITSFVSRPAVADPR